MNIPVLSCLLLIYLEVTFIWILSLFLKDTSIMDVFWGSGFTILAIFLLLTARTYFIRQIILTGMVTLWGMRLSVYLFKRNLGKPEDFRYRAWRSASGKKWWWKSYFQVFLFQGSMMLLVSLPIIVIQSNLQQPALNIVDGIGIFVWLAGFTIESTADRQMAKFKSNPENRGRVLKQGLWACTRHPNYLGEFLVWWGVYLMAVHIPGGVWTILSPLLMSFLLLRISGVPMLEKRLQVEKPDYAQYAANTPAFFPRLSSCIARTHGLKNEEHHGHD